MATTTLVKDLLWRVSELLGDTSPQFQRWTEGILVRWLIDGQMAVTKYLPSACVRTDAIKFAAGTKQSIDTILAANCQPGDGIALTAPLYGVELYSVLRNMGSDGLTIGKSITNVDRGNLDNFDEDWHTKTGAAVQDYVFDERLPTTFYVTPGATASPAMWAEVSYAALPKIIPNTGTPGAELYLVGGASTQTITISDKFTDDLVNYVMARAQMKDAKFAEATKAQQYAAMFINSINLQVQRLTGANPNIGKLPGGTEP